MYNVKSNACNNYLTVVIFIFGATLLCRSFNFVILGI